MKVKNNNTIYWERKNRNQQNYQCKKIRPRLLGTILLDDLNREDVSTYAYLAAEASITSTKMEIFQSNRIICTIYTSENNNTIIFNIGIRSNFRTSPPLHDIKRFCSNYP